jgi:hypothetical protein
MTRPVAKTKEEKNLVRILLDRTVRHNGKVFESGSVYEVSKEDKEVLITKGFAEEIKIK